MEFCFFSTAFFVLLLRCPEIFISGYLNVSTELSSRTVARKVFSPLQSLTSVFGMGTGGPSAFVAPTPTFFEKKVGKETLTFMKLSVSSSKYSSLKIEQQSIPFLKSPSIFCLFFLKLHNTDFSVLYVLHRKEVIQPHLPIRLPCYDLTPIIEPTFDDCPLAVSPSASGVFNFHGLTGGVYKARERIHRDMLIRDY